MSDGEVDYELLASYADGPRIWDAADICPRVQELAEAGLIEPAPEHGTGAYQLTMAGSLELARDSYASDPPPLGFVAVSDQVNAEARDKIDGLLSVYRPAVAVLGEDHATWSLIRHLLDRDQWDEDELVIMLAVAIRLLAADRRDQS